MVSCGHAECSEAAAFWVYDQPTDTWGPRCHRHLVERHPSLEVHAWLESGYARPIETNPPTALATDVPHRTSAFRALVAGAMGWRTESS